MQREVQQLLLINASSNRTTSNNNLITNARNVRSAQNIRPFARRIIWCRKLILFVDTLDIPPELYLVRVTYVHQDKCMYLCLICQSVSTRGPRNICWSVSRGDTFVDGTLRKKDNRQDKSNLNCNKKKNPPSEGRIWSLIMYEQREYEIINLIIFL